MITSINEFRKILENTTPEVLHRAWTDGEKL